MAEATVNHKLKGRRHDWSLVQQFYDEGNDRDACIAQFGFKISAWYKAIRFGKLRASLEQALLR
jgi:hypothetical protein